MCVCFFLFAYPNYGPDSRLFLCVFNEFDLQKTLANYSIFFYYHLSQNFDILIHFDRFDVKFIFSPFCFRCVLASEIIRFFFFLCFFWRLEFSGEGTTESRYRGRVFWTLFWLFVEKRFWVKNLVFPCVCFFFILCVCVVFWPSKLF